MGKLPQEIKLTRHALQRLQERKNPNIHYNTKNLIRSICKWYNRDDLIPDSALYLHSLYVCRKSKQLGYITDGNIEVIYNKNTGVAITILEVKEKFSPITQYIKPEVLQEIERKKVVRKMEKLKEEICSDCGKKVEKVNAQGVCVRCKTRMQNAKARGKEYIPYIKLSDEEKALVDTRQRGQAKRKATEDTPIVLSETPEAPEVEVIENYYQVKAENNPAIAQVVNKPRALSDQDSFINTLRGCGCKIPEESLKDVLNVLMATDKLKDIFMTITKSDNQQALLDLEQTLNVAERKLQHNWEFNGFQELDDIKFKGFLTWRRMLKGAIFFWKKLYQTNALIEMQRAWNAYTQDPNEKITLAGDRMSSKYKRYQISTESWSNILNTRRPFTRVFYAESEEEAYEAFVQWMADRQLHEDKSKTKIIELKQEVN